ncbi:hypothetical protein LPJ72_002491 [Coemansia sp. Benny D160-2]|nr:hypothetical protein LPJ72_002491 [Coemansia sp. Benny D160-2]
MATTSSAHHVFIITGANRGLGRAIAKAVADGSEGAGETRHLLLVGRNKQALEAAGADVVNSYTRVRIVGDVDFSEPPQRATERVVENLKEVMSELIQQNRPSSAAEMRIRLTLVQNAGTLSDLAKTVDQYDGDEVSTYTAVNFVSFAALTAGFLAFAKACAHADRIAIVNISSLLAVKAFANWGLYAAMKAARDQLLKVVAAENAADSQRIKTLNYAPGPLDGDMQAEVRARVGDAAQRNSYAMMHREKNLVSACATAHVLCGLLDAWEFESGAHIDVFDVAAPSSLSVSAVAAGSSGV